MVDTYTITYTNGNTTTFTVSNGKGISSITKTGSAGLIDNYRITYNDGTYFDYTVTNGEDGEVTEEELQDIFEQMSSEMETGTGTGTSIDTSDSAYWKTKIDLGGNTEQDSYEGYNLLNLTNLNESTKANITLTKNEDGTVTLNGTASADANFVFPIDSISATSDYKVQLFKKDGNFTNNYISIYLASNNQFSDFDLLSLTSAEMVSMSLNNKTYTYAQIKVNNGVICNNLTIGVQIIANSSYTTFEPFVGRKSFTKSRLSTRNTSCKR